MGAAAGNLANENPPGCATTGAARDLVCPARTNRGFEHKRQFPGLSSPRRFAFRVAPLNASDKPGEVDASVHAMRRVLGSANLDLHDLANVVEFAAREAPQVASTTDDDAREMIRLCRGCLDLLTNKERVFVRSMAKWRGQPTSRQQAWLSSLYIRCKEERV